MRVLVTGGAGFIGSHLCDALTERGYEVWCVDNFYLGREENIEHLKVNKQFHLSRFDVLDKAKINALFSEAKFDTVFHLAANSDIQQGSQNHKIDLQLNFLTTYEILEAMLAHKVKNIFFASTSAIFGDAKQVLNEDYGPVKPISFYGASKLAAEAYISVFVKNYGFKAWILRFPNVVGERCTHGVVHDFIIQLRRDPSHLMVLGDGTQTKPYLYVKDVIKAILIVFDKAEEPFAVYHVSNEHLTSVREIVAIVTEEMSLSGIPIEYSGGKVGWPGDVPYFEYDISKIQKLGYKYIYNSTESIRITVRKILGKE